MSSAETPKRSSRRYARSDLEARRRRAPPPPPPGYDASVPPVAAEVLARVSLFQRVSAEDRERLRSAASVRDYERGDHVFREGDPSEHFVIVLAGRIKV